MVSTSPWSPARNIPFDSPPSARYHGRSNSMDDARYPMSSTNDRFFAVPKEQMPRLLGVRFEYHKVGYVYPDETLRYYGRESSVILLTDYTLPEQVIALGGTTFVAGSIGPLAHIEARL